MEIKMLEHIAYIMAIVTKICSQISALLGIQWAPMDIPMSRRLQTLAAFVWIYLILFGEAVAIYLFIQLVYSRFWWVGILYGVWFINDIEICNRGGRKSQWVRNWTWWRYLCDYFPIKLVKTVDLDPSKNYMFACFPHGVISLGAFGSFCTNATDFHKLFPGMTCHLITLGGHFLVPFFRDLALALGMCSSSEESLLHLLDDKKYEGNCACMIIGGAAEALDAHPKEYKVILSRRKGFIRVAMKSGASLVPVFSFGETDLFRPLNNPENSLLRRIQEQVRKYTGISPMFPMGRGMFQYSYGVLPMRSPVTAVVGTPMEVKRNLEPTNDEIDAVHAEFTQRLKTLFETEKVKYLKYHAEARLVITLRGETDSRGVDKSAGGGGGTASGGRSVSRTPTPSSQAAYVKYAAHLKPNMILLCNDYKNIGGRVWIDHGLGLGHRILLSR